jgi:hypothetical protein
LIYSKGISKLCPSLFSTTVVSIYFQFNFGKHSKEEYKIWNKNALLSITSPLVLFTDQKSKDEFIQIRSENITYMVYKDVWELMNELEILRNKSYIQEYKNNQLEKDPEKDVHNPDLYAIWNLKAFIMNKTAQLNPFGSSFFIYSDLGAWRNGIIENWPDNKFVCYLNELLKNRMLFGQINYVNDPKGFDINRDSIEGGFYAGSKKAIENYAKLFYKIHDDRLFNKKLFIGKDQTMMNHIAFKTLDSNDYVLLKTWKLHNCDLNNHVKIYDPWLFYQQYFSSKCNFNCGYDKRLSILTNLL